MEYPDYMFPKSEIRFLQNISKKDKVYIFIVCTYVLNLTTKKRLCLSLLEHLFPLFLYQPVMYPPISGAISLKSFATFSVFSFGTTASIKESNLSSLITDNFDLSI